MTYLCYLTYLKTSQIFTFQIFPNGSLNVQRLTEADQGGYTCSVGNNFGSDQIMYELIVQIPPVPPELQVENVTHDAVQITW